MKNLSTLILILIVATSSLIAAGFALTHALPVQPISSPVIIATPTPTPSPTPPPTPTPSPTPIPNISLDYDEVSQTTQGSETVVTLRITATYNFGDTITYNYQSFDLDIRTPRGGLEPFPIYLLTQTVKPMETGSVTVGSNNRVEVFVLTFRFSTIQSSFGGEIPFAYYELVYNSNTFYTATPQPTPSPIPTESPSPTVTELPAIVLLPLLFAIISVALIIRYQKQVKKA